MITLNHLSLPAIIIFLSSIVFPQQLTIYGSVTDINNSPVGGVSIRLTNIASGRSNDEGEFKFVLPLEYKPGSHLKFTLQDNWAEQKVIFLPSQGEWTIPNNSEEHVEIVLLDKGDERLLSHDQLKLLIRQQVDQEMGNIIHDLQTKNKALELKLETLNTEDPLEEEAERLGFTKIDLLAALEKVKDQMRDSGDPYEVGLSELYDKHFSKAAELIKESIEDDEKTLEELNESLSEKYIHLGDSYLGDNNLTAAKESYNKVIKLLPENYKGYFNIAKVEYIEGDLQGAKNNLQLSLKYYKDTDDPVLLAHIKNDLGYLYVKLNENIDNAIQYFKDARFIYQLNNSWYDILATYNNLTWANNNSKNYAEAVSYGNEGINYFEKKCRFTIPLFFEDELNGKLVSDSLAGTLLQKEIKIQQQCDFYINPDNRRWTLTDSKDNRKYFIEKDDDKLLFCEYPGLYAQLKNNLGNAYIYLYNKEKKQDNFEAAVKAYNEALEIRQKEVFPVDYADQVYNLGFAYEHAEGGNGTDNLQKALDYYEDALAVYQENNLSERIKIITNQINAVQNKLH